MLNQKLPEISWLYQDIESSVSDVNSNIDSTDREFLFSPFEAAELDFIMKTFLSSALEALDTRMMRHKQLDLDDRSALEFESMVEVFNENTPYRLPQSFSGKEKEGVAAITHLVRLGRFPDWFGPVTGLVDFFRTTKLDRNVHADMMSVLYWYSLQMGQGFAKLYEQLGALWPELINSPRTLCQVFWDENSSWPVIIRILSWLEARMERWAAREASRWAAHGHPRGSRQ